MHWGLGVGFCLGRGAMGGVVLENCEGVVGWFFVYVWGD
jgi:hypothetical protein